MKPNLAPATYVNLEMFVRDTSHWGSRDPFAKWIRTTHGWLISGSRYAVVRPVRGSVPVAGVGGVPFEAAAHPGAHSSQELLELG